MTSRRGFLGAIGGVAAGLAACAAPAQSRKAVSLLAAGPCPSSPASLGALSGKRLCIPDVNVPPMPLIAPPGVVHDGRSLGPFGMDPSMGYPDVRSFRRKFGLLIPVTNTSVEHELWSLVVSNKGVEGMDGIGLHTATISTPRPQLKTEADLLEYKRQFLAGLNAAIEQALLAQPQYLIMGMSLEHILRGIDAIRAVMADAEAKSGIPWATWHDAAPAALRRFGAKRIGLLTPFDGTGNQNAARMFEDLGFEVVSTFGFACANALHIAHVPDEAKERAIKELLATRENRLDAVVQCGTNMSLMNVTERLEPALGIPVLGINAVTFWYALRENGFQQRLLGAGRLLRDF